MGVVQPERGAQGELGVLRRRLGELVGQEAGVGRSAPHLEENDKTRKANKGGPCVPRGIRRLPVEGHGGAKRSALHRKQRKAGRCWRNGPSRQYQLRACCQDRGRTRRYPISIATCHQEFGSNR